MKARLRIPNSIAFLAGMSILTGVLYPAAVYCASRLLFPVGSTGSLLMIDGAVRGSRLLAQDFESPRYFRARPSASGYAYLGSVASNQGPASAALARAVKERREAWLRDFGAAAPEEMLYASASGLDPEIGPEAAFAQAGRVADARALSPESRESLAAAIRAEAAASASLIGPPRVNVISLNALLDTDPRFADSGQGG
jgi:potassium-transporting ATPase KdpC subunit